MDTTVKEMIEICTSGVDEKLIDEQSNLNEFNSGIYFIIIRGE